LARTAIPIVLAAVLVAGCAGKPANWQQVQVTPEQELATDAAVLKRMGEKPTVADTTLLERVRRVGMRVLEVEGSPGRNWRFTVTDDNRTNAFVLPRGLVVIYAGLLRKIESDEQLAAIIANLAARHLVVERRAPSDEQAISQALEGFPNDPAKLEAGLRKLQVLLQLAPEEEAEIDRLTLTYLARAGYDPRAAIAVFSTPEFSESPAGAARLARFRQFMPDALRIYEARPGT
jgi:predicted Zn-dependent protease